MPFLSKKSLLKEHRILIPLLRSGSAGARKKEAAAQAKEMKHYVRKK
jgi:hypothetical protein